MTLDYLRTALADITDNLAEVIFDSDLYLNSKREKQYPFVLWSLDGAENTKDRRSATIQKTGMITFPAVFIVAKYDPNTQDKLAVWDEIEGYWNEYIDAVNTGLAVQVLEMENMKGIYLHEGDRSADKEIGIMFQKVSLKTFC